MNDFKVNKDSWHYKVVMNFVSVKPIDFCSYWRAFVLSLFVYSILGSVFLGTAGLMIYAAFTETLAFGIGLAVLAGTFAFIGTCGWIVTKIDKSEWWPKFIKTKTSEVIGNIFYYTFVVITSPMWLPGLIVWSAVTWVVDRLPKPPKRKEPDYTEVKEKTPSIFLLKYKSWKEKYCPMVTYEDVTN